VPSRKGISIAVLSTLERRCFASITASRSRAAASGRSVGNLCSQVRDDQIVDIVSAEPGVSVRRQHFENSVVHSRIEMSNVPPPRS